MKLLPIVFALLAVSFLNGASAQMVVNADSAALQPQIGRDAEGFNTCGVRILASLIAGDDAIAYDMSINLRHNIFAGTLKAGSSKATVKSLLENKPRFATVMPAPTSFWIARENQGAGLFPTKTLQGETKGYLLGVGDFVKSFETVEALIAGSRMQLVIRYKSEPLDKVISFSAKMTPEEVGAMESCLQQLTQRMLNRAEKG
jgi:hypothetical protein